MKATIPPLVIAKPCTAAWSAMKGDERRRFCEECGLHVHNLSAMNEREQRAFATENGTRECIAYVPLADGRILTKSWRDTLGRAFRPLRWVLASIVPALFAGCSSSDAVRQPVPGGPAPYDHKHYRGRDQGGAPLLGTPVIVAGNPAIPRGRSR